MSSVPQLPLKMFSSPSVILPRLTAQEAEARLSKFCPVFAFLG
jgi:hypothetical protein